MVDAEAPRPAAKSGEALTVFVCDPSVEAERVSQALRETGHHVVDVPLSMLVARVAVQRPRVILVDADAEGAIETIGRMRELPDTDAIDVLFFGRTGAALSTSEDALAHEGSGFFPRPVDAAAVLNKLHALIEGEEEADAPKEVEPDEPPPAMSSGRRSPVPDTPPSSIGPKSQPPPSRKSSPPASLRDPNAADLRQSPPPSIGRMSVRSGLSEELEHLLAAAEARLGGQQGSSSDLPPPSPEEELDAVLPEAILAALDTPLDDAEEDHEADASANPGTNSSRGTTSRGRAARAEPAPEESSPREALTNDGVPVQETQGERVEAPSTGQTSARGTEAGSVGTALRTSTESRSETSSQLAFGVPPSPHAPLTPFVRRRPSSMPPPNLAPASALSSTMGSEVLLQAGAMLVPLNPTPFAGQPFAGQPFAQQPPSMRLPPQAAPPAAPPPASAHVEVPVAGATILAPGDAARFLAHSIGARQSGAVTIESEEGMRRIVLREGDVVTAASGVESESLLAFLGARGELPRERIEQLAGRLPPYGRHAGAALVAQGALRQDQLWTVLRAHAEWLMGQAIAVVRGRAFLDPEPPGRLRSEPSVFGGSAGAEVLVEVVRRTASEVEAIEGLGGPATVLAEGPADALLTECGLGGSELEAIRSTRGERIDGIVARFPQTDVAQVLYALAMLGVVTPVRALEPRRPRASPTSDTGGDAIDEEALRARIRARVELVEEGDYFAVLGVPRAATGYEIRRAFVELRRTFDPSRLLTPSLLDLADDVRRIVMVLEEAYEILGDSARRERYRRAIEDEPQPQAN